MARLNRLRKKAERMVKMKKTIPRRLKPVLICAICGTAKEAAEKGSNQEESELKRPSGAEAHIDFEAFAARLKSCPFKTAQNTEFFRSL
jgi:hypothetical protein